MEKADIKASVIAEFESARETPHAPYDPAHFTQYLIAGGRSKQGVRYTFKGARRFNRFVRTLQSSLVICFSYKDWEKDWDLDDFVERIIYLQNTPKSSLAAVSRQLKERLNVVMMAIIVVVTTPFVGVTVWLFSCYGLVVCILVPATLIAWVWVSHAREHAYLLNLQRQIKDANIASKASSEPSQGVTSSAHQG